MKKTFYIENLGCAKNQVDAEVMIHSLIKADWQRKDHIEEADVIIVNTCGFIQDAKEESLQTGLEFREAYPDKKVIMAGCLTQRYFEELSLELEEIDGIMGNHTPEEIVQVAEEVLRGQRSLRRTSLQEQYHLGERKPYLSFPGSGYLKIAEGCRNRCSFCSIPLIRGDIKSRSLDEVLDDFKSLLSQGVKEINLVAQDLSSYGRDRGKSEFIELLKSLLEIKGDYWLRPLYIHPDHFPFEIIELMKQDERLLPYFDIPFQHASENILKNMGRKGSAEKHLDLIKSIRNEISGAIMRSTFLVGFPGETQEDFEILEDFQKRAELEWVGVFCYSHEEDTGAYSFENQVEPEIAKQRKSKLEENQISIVAKKLQPFIGRKLKVLIEEEVKEESLFLARGYLQAPEVDGLVVIHADGLKPGDWAKVEIKKVNNVDFEAVLI